jgi:hypothetical protein
VIRVLGIARKLQGPRSEQEKKNFEITAIAGFVFLLSPYLFLIKIKMYWYDMENRSKKAGLCYEMNVKMATGQIFH